MTTNETKISKFLSYVLRHNPDSIGVSISENGWVVIDELISKSEMDSSVSTLKQVVANNDKQRFYISDDGLRIRANQGHSIAVDLKYARTQPPMILYHGTATRFLSNIMKDGLQSRSRQHVHLSADIETARAVGKRHGKPAILFIKAQEMYNEGKVFYLSKNGVWLTLEVAPEFIIVH